jgi:uncharacterized membrane protein
MKIFQKLKIFLTKETDNPVRHSIEAFVIGCIVAIPFGLFLYGILGLTILYCGITDCPEPRRW